MRGGLSSVFPTTISPVLCIIATEIMKCLLCSSSFDNNEELIEHYVTYHKIDPNNRFFQKLFQSNKNCSLFRKCLRCDDFLTTSDFKIKHDFLKHYNEGYNDLFEDKPVDVEKTGNLIFEITVNKHDDYYDFENSEEVADDFLKNVRSRFKPSGLKLTKCSFVIENMQQSAFENLRPILNTRYWTTDVYKATYFNDSAFYGMRQNILSKVIVNGMSGSSSKFRRFVMISLKVLNLDREIVK